MDIRELIAVTAIADFRSFKHAAEHLNSTQPTLSRHVAKVERELEVVLFRRGWSGTESTPAGELVSHYGRMLQKSIEAAEHRIFAGRTNHPHFVSSLTIAQLEVIDAICRTGGAKSAGVLLGRTQPAISRTVNEFKAHMGLTLFERQRSGLSPLPEAIELGALHKNVQNHIASLRKRIGQEKGQLAGRVAIGVLPFSGQELIPRVFARISDLHPRTRLVFVPGTYMGLVEALRCGEIEGIVGVMRKDKCPADLIELPLLEERFTIIARSDHPIHASASTIFDLKNEKWIVPPHGSPVRAYFERMFGEATAALKVQTCEIQFFTAVEQMLADSNSIGMQTYSRSRLAHLRRDLCRIDVELPDEPAMIGLSTLADAPEEPAFVEFKRLLKEMAPEYA